MTRSQRTFAGAVLTASVLALSASSMAAQQAAPPSAPQSAQANTSASFLRMEIMTNCKDGHAFFRVRNAGAAWPKASTFAIYHMGKKGKKLIAKRRMRLRDGQRASFRIKTAKFPAGDLGLWIKPSWYAREFGYDATVNCG